jgi:asparagine synthase (glutamine-hydrolysing)
MATRFLLFRPDPAGQGERHAMRLEAGGRFTRIYSTTEVVVLADVPEGAVLLPDGSGVILGWLFARDPFGARVRSQHLARATGQTHDMATLLHNYWGGYVAVLGEPSSGSVEVLRDPSGIMPCLRVTTPTCHFLVSDMVTACDAGIAVGDIDREGLALSLQTGGLPLQQTALLGVEELPRGMSVGIGRPNSLPRDRWSPWDHTAFDGRLCYEDAVAAVRKTVEDSVGAWAACFGTSVLELSGGLDSSVLAACLAGTPACCQALNFSTDDRSGDERDYARLVADWTGIGLTEVRHRLDDVVLGRATYPDLPVPFGRCIGQAVEVARSRAIEQEAATVSFNGLAGDGVFCFLQSATPIADRMLADGVGLRTLDSIRDVSIQTGCSHATALRLAVQRAWFQPARYHWRSRIAFLSAEYQQRDDRWSHSWLDAPVGTLPGKAAHVASLMRISTHFNAFTSGTTTPSISPLLSQPIVELCLSVPSWFWIRGGRNRAVVRDAFADSLPRAIVERTSKTGPESFCFRVIDRDHDALLRRLMDGSLARWGIIDRAAIEAALGTPSAFMGGDYLRLLELADAEAWVDRWTFARPAM